MVLRTQRLFTPLEWLLLWVSVQILSFFAQFSLAHGGFVDQTASWELPQVQLWRIFPSKLAVSTYEHSSTVEVTRLDKKNGDIFFNTS